MPYSLPQAVLALLQQEGSQPQPKTYFVRSSAKSTKITLVYSKRRRKGEICGGFCLSEPPSLSQETLESTQLYGTIPNRSPAPPLVASPLPPFSKQILHENFTFPSRSVCPTEASTITTSREDRSRSMSVRGRDGYEFNTTPDIDDDDDDDNDNGGAAGDDDDDDDDDDDLSDHYIALSPSLYGDEKPLTPGHDFDLPESPRPPTPNQQNYNFLVGSASKCHHTTTTASPCRQATIEYDVEEDFPLTFPYNSQHPKTSPGKPETADGHERQNHRSGPSGKFTSDSINDTNRSHKQNAGGSKRTVSNNKNNSNNYGGNSNSSGSSSNSSSNNPNHQSSKKSSRPTPTSMLQRSSPSQHRQNQQQPHQRSYSDRRHDADHAMTSSGNQHSYQRVASWDGARP